ncbi:MAG: rod-binding protein [Desulfovibrionaceae bacterium]|nr:rod-binding protein [Desulfovibrionaceae bacterium]
MTPLNAHLDMARSAHSEQAGSDIQHKLASLKGKGLSPEAKEKKLREACEGFESIFIQKMWKEMRKTTHQTTFLHGREEQFWQDMYDQELAKKMTSAGGIGLANMMYEQLSSHLTSASKTTANALSNERHFIPSAAPLLGKPKGEPLLDQPLKPAVFYEEAPQDAPHKVENEKSEPKAIMKPEPVAKVEAKPQNRADETDPSVQNALAAMQANVEAKAQMSAQPVSISYGSPEARQQPVASDLNMSTVVRRQAGDQLGSRGVREPLLPQTKNARDATQRAYERREAKRASSPNLDPNTNQQVFAPMGAQVNQVPQPQVAQPQPPNPNATLVSNAELTGPQALVAAQSQPQPQLQAQAPTPQVRKVTYTTNKPQRQQRKLDRNIIQTLNLDGKHDPSKVRANQVRPAANSHQPQPQIQPQNQNPGVIPSAFQPPRQTALQSPPPYVQPQAQGAQVQPAFQPNLGPKVATGPSQNSDKQKGYTIPPLSASDLSS